jgi:hypothetical protein
MTSKSILGPLSSDPTAVFLDPDLTWSGQKDTDPNESGSTFHNTERIHDNSAKREFVNF